MTTELMRGQNGQKKLQKLLNYRIILKTETMTSQVVGLQTISGLTKREQSKIERLMRSDQLHKAQIDNKSYKRKAPKTKHPEEPQPRKIARTQDSASQDPCQEGNSQSIHSEKLKSTPSSLSEAKLVLKVLNPLNPDFPIGEGETITDHLLNYLYSEQQKQLEKEGEDLTFLDQIEGRPLQSVVQIKETDVSFLKQISEQSKTIKNPFNLTHRDLLKKISIKTKSV